MAPLFEVTWQIPTTIVAVILSTFVSLLAMCACIKSKTKNYKTERYPVTIISARNSVPDDATLKERYPVANVAHAADSNHVTAESSSSVRRKVGDEEEEPSDKGESSIEEKQNDQDHPYAEIGSSARRNPGSGADAVDAANGPSRSSLVPQFPLSVRNNGGGHLLEHQDGVDHPVPIPPRRPLLTAASAISGRTPASSEIPYMTPPLGNSMRALPPVTQTGCPPGASPTASSLPGRFSPGMIGRTPASSEIPYMTPPLGNSMRALPPVTQTGCPPGASTTASSLPGLPSEPGMGSGAGPTVGESGEQTQHFSGDSSESSKGYTHINVRQPLRELRAHLNTNAVSLNPAASLQRGDTGEDSEDALYAAISGGSASDYYYATIGDSSAGGGASASVAPSHWSPSAGGGVSASVLPSHSSAGGTTPETASLNVSSTSTTIHGLLNLSMEGAGSPPLAPPTGERAALNLSTSSAGSQDRVSVSRRDSPLPPTPSPSVKRRSLKDGIADLYARVNKGNSASNLHRRNLSNGLAPPSSPPPSSSASPIGGSVLSPRFAGPPSGTSVVTIGPPDYESIPWENRFGTFDERCVFLMNVVSEGLYITNRPLSIMEQWNEESPMLSSRPEWFRHFIRECLQQLEKVLSRDALWEVHKVFMKCLQSNLDLANKEADVEESYVSPYWEPSVSLKEEIPVLVDDVKMEIKPDPVASGSCELEDDDEGIPEEQVEELPAKRQTRARRERRKVRKMDRDEDNDGSSKSNEKSAGILDDDESYKYMVCDHCDKKCSVIAIKKHIKRQHGLELARQLKFQCQFCNKEVKSGFGLMGHIERWHLRTQLCPVCKLWISETRFEKHMSDHAERPLFPCDQCAQSFVTQKKLYNHVRRDHSEKVVCDVCGKDVFPWDLERHRRLHVAKTISCPNCPLMFRTDEDLKEHQEIVHENRQGHMCHICGKKYPIPSLLKKHVMFHEESNETFPCPQCPKKFCRVASLKKHLLVHAGVRRHACSQCSKAYFSARCLKDHMNSVHLNVRPFTCPHCPKAYPASGALYLHMKLKHKGFTVAGKLSEQSVGTLGTAMD
ncbi:unnamed protein product [Cyprideis torosa]|uniref:Uncharacterized protein n=1 Tax=Cyprideis torosa TaxID=163714 RepID=A0A7R8W8U4_9CRUS|nr:unnamed protein product [Cyprideis torosa]CAG0886606.1 unnamed protein product [Cyprideis torosa]